MRRLPVTQLQAIHDITTIGRSSAITPARRDRNVMRVREGGDRRLLPDRRRQPRGVANRRQGERRRAPGWRSLLTVVIMAVPVNATDLAHRTSVIPAAPQAPPARERSAPPPPRPAAPRPRGIDAFIAAAGRVHGVPATLIREVIRAESGFNARAVSTSGAKGLMQIMPAVAKQYGAANPFDPRQNIFAGAGYLGELLDRHDGDVRLALASYNAGPTAVARFGGMPPYRETREYVRKILKRLPEYNSRRSTSHGLRP